MPKPTNRTKQAEERPKKITIKFFLNQAIQPRIEEKKKLYPLYMLITYNRKNTMLKSHYGGYYKDLKDIDRVNYPGLLAFEQRIVNKSIAYEIDQRKGKFTLKGIYKKYEKYCIGIDELLSYYFKDMLYNTLLHTEPTEFMGALNFSDPKVSFDTLYTIVKKIYPGLNETLPIDFDQLVSIYTDFMRLFRGSFFQYTFPTVIDWLDQSAVHDYREKLEAIHKQDKRMIAKSISLIDKVVKSSLM